MSERLTLDDMLEAIRPHCRALNVSRTSIDWTKPDGEADRFLSMGHECPSYGPIYRAIAEALRAYARHLDFVAGAQSERANAVALLRQEQARHQAASTDVALCSAARDRCAAKASVLTTMAAYIERGDRAGQGVEMPPRPQVAPAAHAEHHVGLKHTGPYGCGDRSCRICFG